MAKNARLTNSPYGFTREIKEPLSRNLYIYGNGNPLKYVDPSGHIAKAMNNLNSTARPSNKIAGQTNCVGVLKDFGLGVLSALLSNGIDFANIVTAANWSLFSKDIATRSYIQTARSKEELQSRIMKLVTSNSAFYAGKLITDVILILGGAITTVRGVIDFLTGLGVDVGSVFGAGASLGTLTPVAALTFATGAAIAAVGVAEVGAGISLTVSAWNNGRKDMGNLIKAIQDGGGKENFKKYEPKQIEKMYNLKKGQFHREVKPDIISRMKNKNSPYYNEFKKMGENPDIYLSSDGTIKIVSTQFKGKSFETTLNIKDFLP